MKLKPDFEEFELKNGLRVLHQQNDRTVGHCALMINAGTRDELEDESGIAHFIEHAIFKGTKKRKSYHILNRLDSVGGEIDAYTTKELTCFYASFLTEYYDRAIDLISDITFNSQFPKNELEKEKEVVLDEINIYKDSPSELIYDDFEAQVFSNHALGRPILGTEESVKSLNKTKITAYLSRLYQPSNMVFASIGNISRKKLEAKLNRYFGDIKNQEIQLDRKPFIANPPKIVHELKPIHQSHCIMGKAVMGANDPNRLSFILLNNIIGGPAMNSILNLKIREKHGYTYNIESNYSIYSDKGLFSIYLACDPKYITRAVKAVKQELKKLREKPLSTQKLTLSKQQLKGQLAIGRESKTSMMLSFGKSHLMKNNILTLDELHQRIDAITKEDLHEMAKKHLNFEDFDFLYYDGKPE